MDITATDLQAKLSAHARWLAGDEDGVRLNLRGVDLSRVNLSGANLTRADLSGADLSGANMIRADLSGANMTRANLSGADMRWANMARADLSGANMRWVNLRDADLSGGDLRGADLDFSCWPLWCGTKGVFVDARIAAQLAAHFCALDCDDPAYQEAREALLPFARTSHRAKDLGLIEDEED
jgi:hypothetical protein